MRSHHVAEHVWRMNVVPGRVCSRDHDVRSITLEMNSDVVDLDVLALAKSFPDAVSQLLHWKQRAWRLCFVSDPCLKRRLLRSTRCP